MKNAERLRSNGDFIRAHPERLPQLYSTERLIQPPLPGHRMQGAPVASDRVEIRTFQHEFESWWNPLLNLEPVGRLEPALRRKGFPDELVFELHRAVPWIPLHSVLLKSKLVRRIEVNIRPFLCAGANIDVIQGQDIRFQPLDLQGAGGLTEVGGDVLPPLRGARLLR